MKLRALLSVALIAAFGAPAVFAADAQPAWHTMAQRPAALEQAAKLGRPIAVLWYADTQKAGPPGKWIDQWKKSDLPKQFVCITSESKVENHKIMVDPFVMKLLKANGIDLQRVSPPYLLLGSAQGKGYGSLHSGSTLADAVGAIQAALQKHGGGVVQKPAPGQPAPDNNPPRPAPPAGAEAAQKQPQNPAAPPAPRPPATPVTKIPRIKAWYEMDEKAQALEAARIFGRPIALAWHLEGRSKNNLRKWKTSSLAKYCVGLTVASKLNKNTYGLDDELLRRVFMASGLDLQATRPPCVFICTTSGQFLSIVRADANKDGIAAVLREVAKKYGRIPTVRQAVGGWKRLDAARKHWSVGKYAAALDCYREVAALEKLNPAMPIIGELHKDTGAIALRGARELEAAKELLTTGKLKEAEARVRQIHRTYKGFDTAKEAKALFAQVRVAQNERAIAAKETGEADVDNPMGEPVKKDDDKADPGKKEDDKDKKVDKDDELEDDF